jgi:hypothetical protein
MVFEASMEKTIFSMGGRIIQGIVGFNCIGTNYKRNGFMVISIGGTIFGILTLFIFV